MSNRSILILPLLLLVSGWLFSCAPSSNPDIERGSSYFFRDGYPEVRISALGILDEQDQGVISVTADVVYGSLIYRERSGQNQAEIDLEIRVTGQEGTSYSETFTQSLAIPSNQEGYVTNQEVLTISKELITPPGRYEVFVSITDRTSGNRTTRSAEAFIPDPEDNILNITAIQMLAKQSGRYNDEFKAITTYDLSMANDSVRFVVQVTNNRSENPTTIRSQLIRFEADTTPARPMSFNNYSPSSLPYKGINYDSRDVLDETFRILDQPGSVLIEYRYPVPERGNYRFEVRVEGDQDLFKARDFAVRSENYPALRSPRELAEPLAYLMEEKNYENLLKIEDPDEMKAAIDRFWLSSVGSMNRARNVISLYYERVEQANKQFSNFKEGWKTDMGMIYILFGPPWYVDRSLNRMQWSYSYDRSDPRYNFYFERPRMPSEFYPFDNYLLVRTQGYFNLQYQQVQLWLTGQILNTNM